MAYGLLDVMKDAALGNLEYVNQEHAAQRYAICVACPHFNSTFKTCGICHCFMPEKVKHAKSECADKNNKRWLPVNLIG